MNGKGDRPRPVDHEKYSKNFDRIFRKAEEEVQEALAREIMEEDHYILTALAKGIIAHRGLSNHIWKCAKSFRPLRTFLEGEKKAYEETIAETPKYLAETREEYLLRRRHEYISIETAKLMNYWEDQLDVVIALKRELNLKDTDVISHNNFFR